MGTHLRLQRRVWFARFRVPADVRDAFNGKAEVYMTLNTGDRATAALRAAPIIARLRAHVLEARGNAGSVENEALWWRKQIANDHSETSALQEVFETEAARRFLTPAQQSTLSRQHGLDAYGGSRLAAIEALGGDPARLFIGIATGRRTPLAPHIEPWNKAYRASVEAKTADMAKNEVSKFIEKFPTLDLVTRKAVAGWSRERTEAGAKAASIRRAVSALRAFWTYLQEEEVAPEDVFPFASVPVAEKSKEAAKAGYRDFAPKDVARLHQAAKDKGDGDLADLIAMAGYTGARIEELCSLSLNDCQGGVLTISDAKTVAGNRKVPIHSALEGLLKRRQDKRAEGYLFADLTENKYGDRSNAIGKRFGRLKEELGFKGRQWAFHSIRKTVTTQFEHAGIAENVVADIVGHDKPRITYGVYSGGTTMVQRRKALSALSYPASLRLP